MSQDTTAVAAPCAVDAALWRECLKTFDYSPERPKDACLRQRQSYYTCMKDWSLKVEGRKYDPHRFYTTEKCSKEAEKLHTCMMTGMFEIGNCRQAMLALKACGYLNDPQVREALADDDEVLAFIAKSKASESPQWWKKLIGKA